MRVLTSVAELDEMLAECTRAAQNSDGERRKVFSTFRMNPPAVPRDPFSEDYKRFQLDFYHTLAGKDYRLENEATVFDVDSMVYRPFPYCTGSPPVVSEQFRAIGALLSRIRVGPGARIVEFGPGWGNTTMALAMMGYDVTVVDIEPRFCELLEKRAAVNGVKLNIVNADFTWAETVTNPYDLAIFFECFHHSQDHRRLLRSMNKALTDDASILFGGEPILADFPMPWGLRLDGQSLWAIRQHGWFELGFNSKYFVEVLAREGWSATRFASTESAASEVWEARKARRVVQSFHGNDPQLAVPSQMRTSAGIRLRELSNQWGFFGPYISLAPGKWEARAVLNPNSTSTGIGTFDVCAKSGQQILARRNVDLSKRKSSHLAIEFSLPQITENIEIRWYCNSPVTLAVDRVEFIPQIDSEMCV